MAAQRNTVQVMPAWHSVMCLNTLFIASQFSVAHCVGGIHLLLFRNKQIFQQTKPNPIHNEETNDTNLLNHAIALRLGASVVPTGEGMPYQPDIPLEPSEPPFLICCRAACTLLHVDTCTAKRFIDY